MWAMPCCAAVSYREYLFDVPKEKGFRFCFSTLSIYVISLQDYLQRTRQHKIAIKGSKTAAKQRITVHAQCKTHINSCTIQGWSCTKHITSD